ncbi:MAG: hypothetical protein KFH98_06605 [Gemmatimonadetes bacterium]|nr:hypothetical protein [Gemmatimonadota bacterium]
MPLPQEVAETSGLARSGRDADLFWTHNDRGNDPVLFAIDSRGEIVQRVRVTGVEMTDWEDLESAPCGEETCLYVADIGDNDSDRDGISVLRIVEPAAEATEVTPAEILRARFPDGARDAEALFTDGAGLLHVINKGDAEDIAIYRWPAPGQDGGTVTLERLRVLFPEPGNGDDRVTAATAMPGSSWMVARTYRSLYFYPLAALLGGEAVEPTVVDLSMLSEAQGESVVLSDGGDVWVSSEAERRGQRPVWSQLRCTLPTP